MSVGHALAQTRAQLASAGCENAAAEAEILLEHVLECARAELYSADELPLKAAQGRTLSRYVERRRAREPLAYVIGEWSFRRLRLEVNPAVLIPRPETELLVEHCLARLSQLVSPRVLDIGTGSGAIALSIADEHEGACLTAVDNSADALVVASSNARTHSLDGRVRFVNGDLFAAEAGPFELVVSNPPYVSALELAELEPEVAQHEPRNALVGCGFHERIAAQAPSVLSAGGWLLMECHEEEASEFAEHLRATGWRNVSLINDLTGRPRIVEARSAAADARR